MIVVRGSRRVAALALIVILAGATAFGLWHLVVGGLMNGNPRAGGFGLVLALVSGALLAGSIAIVRRRVPH